MHRMIATSFRTVPPFARGLVRDLRLRWAAREVGQPYEIAFIGFDERTSPEYLKRHPFAQVPAAEIDGESMFESGAILYAMGLRSQRLMPKDDNKRLQILSWMFAALNTVEPPILTLFSLDILNPDPDRPADFRDITVATIRTRLSRLADALQGRDYLMGAFSIADIVMTTTLRFLRHTDLVAEQPAVAEYLTRCEARPAFAGALAEQQGDYAEADALAA